MYMYARGEVMSLNDTVSKYLLSLEKSFLQLHSKSESIKDDIKSYKYIQNLLEVLEADRLGFCGVVEKLNDKQIEDFRNRMEKVVPGEVTDLLAQSKKYYDYNTRLKTDLNSIDDLFSFFDQLAKSEKVLHKASEEMKTYLARVDIEEKKTQLLEAEEKEIKIFSLGGKFDENGLIEPIGAENVDFFEETVNSADGLEDFEKTNLVSYVTEFEVKSYKDIEKRKKSRKSGDLVPEKKEELSSGGRAR